MIGHQPSPRRLVRHQGIAGPGHPACLPGTHDEQTRQGKTHDAKARGTFSLPTQAVQLSTARISRTLTRSGGCLPGCQTSQAKTSQTWLYGHVAWASCSYDNQSTRNVLRTFQRRVKAAKRVELLKKPGYVSRVISSQQQLAERPAIRVYWTRAQLIAVCVKAHVSAAPRC